MTKFWDFFDKIYCINLITRDDRYKKTKLLFKQLNIPVKYFRTEKHPTDGALGCYESHLSIIQEAYDNNYDHVFIFEDDVQANERFTTKLLDKAYEFVSTNKDWDIFYLGHFPDILFNNSTVISKNIMKVSSCQAHAYAISRKCMKDFLSKKYVRAIDYVYHNYYNCYALYPMIFDQDMYDIRHDIDASIKINPYCSVGIRLCEEYAYTVNYSIINVIIFIILGVFVLLLIYYLSYLLL